MKYYLNRMIMAAAIAASIAIAGCGPSDIQGTELQLQQLHNGKTTYSEVLKSWGTPTSDQQAADGSRTVTYVSTEQRAESNMYTPVLGVFSGNIDRIEEHVTMQFNPAGVLQNYTESSKPAKPASE